MSNEKSGKETRHIDTSIFDNFYFRISESIFFGGLMGGFRQNWNNNGHIEFYKIGILYGALIAPLSIILHTEITAILGFILYHNEGAFIGSVIGTSFEAFIGGALGLLISRQYLGVVAGMTLGFSIDNIKNFFYENYLKNHINSEKDEFNAINFTTTHNLRGASYSEKFDDYTMVSDFSQIHNSSIS